MLLTIDVGDKKKMTFFLSGEIFAHVYQTDFRNSKPVEGAFQLGSAYAEFNKTNKTVTMLSRELPMEFMEITQLENLIIQPFTAGDVFSLSFVNYPKLASVIFSSCSFWNISHCNSEDFKKKDYTLEFKNCPSLEALKIDEYACWNFNQFIMENCNSIKKVCFSNETLPFIRSISVKRKVLLIELILECNAMKKLAIGPGIKNDLQSVVLESTHSSDN